MAVDFYFWLLLIMRWFLTFKFEVYGSIRCMTYDSVYVVAGQLSLGYSASEFGLFAHLSYGSVNGGFGHRQALAFVVAFSGNADFQTQCSAVYHFRMSATVAHGHLNVFSEVFYREPCAVPRYSVE